jgi:hypothetical protein
MARDMHPRRTAREALRVQELHSAQRWLREAARLPRLPRPVHCTLCRGAMLGCLQAGEPAGMARSPSAPPDAIESGTAAHGARNGGVSGVRQAAPTGAIISTVLFQSPPPEASSGAQPPRELTVFVRGTAPAKPVKPAVSGRPGDCRDTPLRRRPQERDRNRLVRVLSLQRPGPPSSSAANSRSRSATTTGNGLHP